MRKYKASERKVDVYDIGDGLTLMNVIIKNQDGKMECDRKLTQSRRKLIKRSQNKHGFEGLFYGKL